MDPRSSKSGSFKHPIGNVKPKSKELKSSCIAWAFLKTNREENFSSKFPLLHNSGFIGHLQSNAVVWAKKAYHALMWRQQDFQPFGIDESHVLVVSIFTVQQTTGTRGAGWWKCPRPDPYGAATTFIASHIISKLRNKQFSVDALSRLSSPALQSGSHSRLWIAQWIMPL